MIRSDHVHPNEDGTKVETPHEIQAPVRDIRKLRSIFDQWSKLHSTLNSQPEVQILNGLKYL